MARNVKDEPTLEVDGGFWDRLLNTIENRHPNMSLWMWCRKNKISYSTVDTGLRRGSRPKVKTLFKLAKALNVNPYWLANESKGANEKFKASRKKDPSMGDRIEDLRKGVEDFVKKRKQKKSPFIEGIEEAMTSLFGPVVPATDDEEEGEREHHGESIIESFIELLEHELRERREIGREKYGYFAFSKKDVLRELEEELMDIVNYSLFAIVKIRAMKQSFGNQVTEKFRI